MIGSKSQTCSTLAFGVVLTLVIPALVFAGGQGEKEVTTGTLTQKTITVVYEDDGAKPWGDPDYPTMKLLAESGNVIIKPMPIPRKEMSAKMTTIIAGGNIPDLMYIRSVPNLMKEYGPKGLFVAVDEYFDRVPNFARRMETIPGRMEEYRRMFKATDGHIYAFPFIKDSRSIIATAPYIRSDILDYDVQQIETLDDLYEALKEIKEIKGNPPWIARPGTDLAAVLLERVARLYRIGIHVYWDTDEQKFNFGPYQSEYRSMIEFMRKAYAEEIFHPDIFTMADKQWEELMHNDGGYFTIDNFKINLENWEVILPPKINGVRGFASTLASTLNLGRYWVISAKTDALDNILQLVDYGYSEEFTHRWAFGVEGETYETTADGRHVAIIKPATDDDPRGIKHILDWYQQNGGGTARNCFLYEGEFYDGRFFKNNYLFEVADRLLKADALAEDTPGLTFTEDELDMKKTLETPITTYIDESVAGFVTGSKPLSDFDDFVTRLKKMGADDLMKIYDAAFARYVE